MLLHCLVLWFGIVSDKKFVVCLCSSVCNVYFSVWLLLRFFSVSLVFRNLVMMYIGVVFLVFIFLRVC